MEVGLTATLPDAAPWVLKFVPAQDVADVPLEDQVSVVESPADIVVELALIITPVPPGVG